MKKLLFRMFKKHFFPFTNIHYVKTDNIKIRKGQYLISNIVGTSTDFDSKKRYWEKHTGRRFTICSTRKCTSRATVGAHVWIKSPLFSCLPRPWKTVFIVPLCQVKCYKRLVLP